MPAGPEAGDICSWAGGPDGEPGPGPAPPTVPGIRPAPPTDSGPGVGVTLDGGTDGMVGAAVVGGTVVGPAVVDVEGGTGLTVVGAVEVWTLEDPPAVAITMAARSTAVTTATTLASATCRRRRRRAPGGPTAGRSDAPGLGP